MSGMSPSVHDPCKLQTTFTCLEHRSLHRCRWKKHGRCHTASGITAESTPRIELGKSGLQVSRIGIGTLQWGDPGQGFGDRFSEDELKQVFHTAVQGGINFFDTAEVYGYQSIKTNTSSEQILGRCITETDVTRLADPLVVGTKFFTIPWTNVLVGGGFRIGKASILEALTASLQRLGDIDLYQVHFPFPTFPQQVLADALTKALESKRVKAVGVCNYNARQLEELHGILDKRGISLASNQVKFSLLERKPLDSGLLTLCNELGITLVAHSPLKQGLLTDKYVSEGGGGEAERVRPLLKLMQFIGAVSGGKSVAQVALNYLVAKGAIPIPGAKSVQQVQDHVSALQWELEENEVAILDEKLASMKL